MKQYFYLPALALAAMMLARPSWNFVPIKTVYTWSGGDTVTVYDSTIIDSLGLRGWLDMNVRYPINTNDSENAHIVYLADSEIAR